MGKWLKTFWATIFCLCLFNGISLIEANAATISNSSSVGLQGTIPSSPPTSAATISSPGNGTNFTNSPININGICQTGLLIKILDNNVFVGSALCVNGTYSLQISLFNGQNQIIAQDFDSLNQSGPNSTTIDVNYSSAQFSQTGNPVTLTSSFAEKGAEPGTNLEWPIVLSGGTSPYAISVDWGDGSTEELLSENATGMFYINHQYKFSGVYTVIVRVTDKNGVTSFLQLVGQATGLIKPVNNSNKSNANETVIWWPTLATIPLLFVSFWIGSRHRLQKIRHDVAEAEDENE
jgi:hypothetical protein